MHRLFVAIQPPRAVRAHLLETMGGVRGARWRTDAQLHLTLRFIGEVERPLGEDIAAALGGLTSPRLALVLEAPGTFDRRGGPDSLWIGVGPRPALAALHRKIDQALVRAGLPPERRAFVPHITLARLGHDAGDPGAAIARGGAAGMAFEAGDVCLYESELGRDGASYTIVARYPLG